MDDCIKLILLLIIGFLLILGIHHVAFGAEGKLNVSAEVTCNCIVNGVVVPINQGACVPECGKLKQQNSYNNINIHIDNNEETITY